MLESLNDAQRKAVTAPEGPVLVIAGPGSGKTRVLTFRIAYLIDHYKVPAAGILAVTFTNKAAREMEERVEALLGQSNSRLTLGTFHSICARILRREARYTPYTPSFTIYDSGDQRALVKQIIVAMGQDPKKFNPYSVLSAISSAKNELLGPEEFPVHTYSDQVHQRVYEKYQETLIGNNAMDFDDLLVNTVRLFQQNSDVLARYQRHYTHVLVDEFQDTNTVQYELVRLLGGERKHVFVVGDPDQSIYAFRGADYRNVKRFQKDFEPALILLEENYRSHQHILDAANAIIQQNHDHIPRNLYSQRKDGEKIFVYEAYDERDEADYVVNTIRDLCNKGLYAEDDFAVMYRMNAQSRALEESFIQKGMPYVLVGATRFYERKEIKDVLAFMRVVYNPNDRVSLNRIINVPPRGIGAKTLQQFDNLVDALGGSAWEGLQKLYEGDKDIPISGRAKSALTSFAEMMVQLVSYQDKKPLEILDAVLDETGYWAMLQADNTPVGEDRQENIAELRRVADEDRELTLGQFLEKVSLVADVDTLTGNATEAPTLLTLHAAKGLEFPVVFIIGMEEGTLPHWRSQDDPDQMAEERRLLYVGITRAKDRLYLMYAFRRMLYGQYDVTDPSHFIDYLPPETVNGNIGYKEQSSAFTYKQETTWSPYDEKIVQFPKKKKSQKTTFKIGEQVTHKSFGEGIVVKTHMRQDIEEVEVLFKDAGQKRLDASYLQPL
jgi:DNA helicase-2/ATP-dependent DNA helicase PcrA